MAHAHTPGKVGAAAGSQSAVPWCRRLAALGDEDSDQGCITGPVLLVGCLCSQECGGSTLYLLSGPSAVAVIHVSETLDGSGGSRRWLTPQLM